MLRPAVFDSDARRRALALGARSPLRRWVGESGGAYVVGPLLSPTVARPGGPSPSEYASDVSAWAVPAASVEVEDVLLDALGAILGSRPVRLPGHAPFTLRAFPPGTESPWHTDNYRHLEAYATLRSETVGSQWSWFVPLAAHEGGALEIPTLNYAEAIAPGTLVVFEGSELLHRVAPVEGHTVRWTLGGFAARRRVGGWLAWS